MIKKIIARLIFLLIIGTITSLSLHSQTHHQMIGFKAGALYSNINEDDDTFQIFKDSKYKFGFGSNITYDYQMDDHSVIVTGLGYIQRGFYTMIVFTNEFGKTIGDGKIYYNYDYIEIPIKIKYQFGDKFKFYGFLGIAPNYLIKSNYHIPAIGNTVPEHTENTTNDVAKIDFTGEIGLGISYDIDEKFKIGLDFSYNHGTMTVTTKKYFDGIELVHYNFESMIGVQYVIK
ncbi:MAG: hypothetical protein A2X01_15215 [Bacteroidetes bacterium GWF2_35_48]|nr:MAG: hypothetical protein A2X01_15215 [Bacteroidetes bacterium GWF2_35_48]